jgi:hypothetical protein
LASFCSGGDHANLIITPSALVALNFLKRGPFQQLGGDFMSCAIERLASAEFDRLK